MARIIKKVSLKTGLPPGSLVHVGEERAKKTAITIIDYNQETYTETPDASVAECRTCMAADTVTWINVSGIQEVPVLEEIGAAFSLHPLVMEDIMNTTQRPKMEAYEHYIYIVMKMVYEDEKSQTRSSRSRSASSWETPTSSRSRKTAETSSTRSGSASRRPAVSSGNPGPIFWPTPSSTPSLTATLT